MTGILKGYDQLMNLVLDETVEYMRCAAGDTGATSRDRTRKLGFTVIRGTILVSISPVDGSEVIYVQTGGSGGDTTGSGEIAAGAGVTTV